MAVNTIRALPSEGELRFSPDGATAYVLANGISAYSTATGALITRFSGSFSAFDLTADGSSIIATSSVVNGIVSTGNSSGRNADVVRINVADGSSTTYRTLLPSTSGPFNDVEVLANGKVLLGDSPMPLSGPVDHPPALYTLDLASGSFAATSLTSTIAPQIVNATEEGLLLVTGERGNDGTFAALFDPSGRLLVSKDADHGHLGIGVPIARAVSTATGQVLIGDGATLNLYDTSLNLQRNLMPLLLGGMGGGRVGEVAFSADGARLYAANPDTHAVYEFSTTDWSLQRAFALGVPGSGKFLFSPDGHILALGATLIDLSTTNQISGDGGNNVLTGTAAPDYISGLAGNDRLEGGSGGGDTLVGGAGDDVYVIPAGYGGPADIIVEAAGGGNDTVVTSVDYTLPANVETMRLAPGSTATLVGNAQGGTLIGNDLGTRLSGYAGDTVMIGGRGDDVLEGDSGDTAVFNDSIANLQIEIVTTSYYRTTYSILVTTADGRDTIGSTDLGRFGLVPFTVGTLRFNDASVSTVNFAQTYLAFREQARQVPTVNEYIRFSTVDTVDVPAAVAAWLAGGADAGARIIDSYHRYMGRTPSPSEVNAWLGNFRSGGNYQDLRTAIVNDQAGRAHTASTVADLYRTYMGRDPSDAEIAAWDGNIRGGAEFDAVKVAILNDSFGRAHTVAAVQDLYRTYMGREPGANEIAVWDSSLRAGYTYADVKNAILNDGTGHAHTVATITELYRTYMGRDPNAGEIVAWDANLHGGATFATVKTAILSDPFGRAHTDATVTDLYVEYMGRAPSSYEKDAWYNNLRYQGRSFDDVRNAILGDGVGQKHTADTLGALYGEYFGRAPGANEIASWTDTFRRGADFDTTRDTLIRESASVQRLFGTSGADMLAATGAHAMVIGFDPAADTIDLRGHGYIDPLGHAREVVGVDGDTDVLVSFDPQHDILLRHITLAQLTTSDFLL